MQWQTIDSAPKDGATILGWSEYMDEPCTVRWRNNEWESSWDGWEVVEYMSDFGTEYRDPGPVTHWMPLPEPPKDVPLP